MAMNFWEAQRKAKSRTWLFLFVFIFLTLLMATLSELAMRYFAGPENYNPSLPYIGLIFVGITFITAAFQYSSYSLYGGSYVAQSAGGIEVTPDAPFVKDPKIMQLMNIVHEVALAASLPVPPVYILNNNQINAFAAGLTPDKAAIAVTIGALQKLSRDELTGVLAHEFGHLYNGDSKISLRLAAMVMGFTIILYLGIRIMEGSFLFGGGRRDRDGDGGGGGGGIALAGLILLIAGAITWVGGTILKSLISQQREYLADACAVQFTRNPNGIAGALRKIAGDESRDMPKSSMAYSHLYFNDQSFWASLFATHPPIEKRIAAIEGREYMPDEWKKKDSDSDQRG